MKTILLFTFSFLGFIVNSQTWSGEVASIFYNKCAKCHNPAGISTTPLTTFAEVSPLAAAIQSYVTDDEMPPWPPSKTYQTYQHDRSLTASEKATILTWVGLGAPEGDAASTPPVPIFSVGALLGAGDLEVRIPTYMSKASALGDDYACFSVPSGLLVDRKIKSIEIIPGNRQIVHHALIFVDPAGTEVTDSIGGNCSSPSNPTTVLIAGYTPGSSPMTLPTTSPLKLGMSLPAGSNIYFNMHYPNGTYGEFDSTKVIFHFYPIGETGIREVFAGRIIENWAFNLPPNVLTTVTDSYPALSTNMSILSVFPHQHLIGKSIKAFGITPALDTLRFIDIPKWDFHWQDFYFFKNIIKAPTGTIIKGIGVYDNTASNPNNPNSPPIAIGPGLNTSDEMFLVYFHYMLYQAGDETYDLQSLMGAALKDLTKDEIGDVVISPNPSSDESIISLEASIGDKLSMYIYDTQGNVVNKLVSNSKVTSKKIQINWDGKNEQGISVHKGLYFVSINLNGKLMTKRIIRL